jgi:hypothetical protein
MPFKIFTVRIDTSGMVHECKEIDTMKGPRIAFGIILVTHQPNPKGGIQCERFKRPFRLKVPQTKILCT